MAPLKFKYIRVGDLSKMEPINENKKLANELKLTVSLADYLEDLSKSEAYILIKVAEDGQSFQNEIIGALGSIKYIHFNN